jgi:hypothetical protein
MEEPGNLEITTKNVTGKPAGGNRFLGSALELEYGVKGWWTTELYLDGQRTAREGAVFTGYRWENRFRVLPREHWINPVLYLEFENINGADKSLLEVVANDGEADLTGLNAETRYEKKRELEAKLILGSYFKGWTFAENFIAEKNVRHAPFEFGYAVGSAGPWRWPHGRTAATSVLRTFKPEWKCMAAWERTNISVSGRRRTILPQPWHGRSQMARDSRSRLRLESLTQV